MEAPSWHPAAAAAAAPRRRRYRPPAYLRAAKAELEAEARAAAEAEREARAEAEKKREAEGRKKPGKPGGCPAPEAPTRKRRRTSRIPRAAS